MNSLRADVGQLLWMGFPGTSVPDAFARRLAAGEVGAAIVFKHNLVIDDRGACDLRALVALCDGLHRGAGDPLIAIDQEGGRVQRVKSPATVWPPMMALDRGGGDDAALAESVGRAMGDELHALGLDIDFAPVLDVHTNPANPIIGDRAFGTTAVDVSRRALAYARGLAASGVLGCGKHFPGHGDTDTDSHLELPRIDHPWERLESVELAPFAAAARAGTPVVPMIMTAHVVFAALDATRPATLSPEVVTGLLRDRLGFRGVIVSDDLDMKAIAGTMGADVAAVAAVRAGCDVLLLCHDEANQALAERALVVEGERDAALRAQIAESAARVRAMKAARPRLARGDLAVVGSAAHRALAARLTASLTAPLTSP